MQAAERLPEPARTGDAYIGRNGRLAAWITHRVGTMTAFYVATVFQLGWIALAQAHLITFDPYPFPFLLFLSSLAQLLLMFVIMVGQQVIGARQTGAHCRRSSTRRRCCTRASGSSTI